MGNDVLFDQLSSLEYKLRQAGLDVELCSVKFSEDLELEYVKVYEDTTQELFGLPCGREFSYGIEFEAGENLYGIKDTNEVVYLVYEDEEGTIMWAEVPFSLIVANSSCIYKKI